MSLILVVIKLILAQESVSVCDSGYILNHSNQCIQCAIGCKTCESETRCSECLINYFLDKEFGECFMCSTECYKCESQENCLSCFTGYAKDGYCYECGYDCLSCDESGCKDCRLGKYIYGDSCLSCSDNCQLCNSFTSCTYCDLDYILVDGTCVFSPCYYSETGECDSCIDGYIFANNTCEYIGDCYTINGYECDKCYDGNYLENGKCFECIENCEKCQNNNTCDICSPGYYYNKSMCVQCMRMCISCDSSGCLECESYTYITNDRKCKSCPRNCYSCESYTNCTSCYDFYYLENGQCNKCSENCIYCDNKTDCSLCFQGFLKDGICHKCIIDNCNTCNESSCISCNQGYLLEYNKCKPDFCELNSSNGECLMCLPNYYLKDGVCIKNSFSCEISQPYSDRCNKCKSGFFLNEFGHCPMCLHFCESCTNNYTCSLCYKTAYLDEDDGTCKPCGNYCADCNKTLCFECLSNYDLVDGECKCLDEEGCEQRNKVLNECIDGYFQNGRACLECSQACLQCESLTKCTLCADEYYLYNGLCNENQQENFNFGSLLIFHSAYILLI